MTRIDTTFRTMGTTARVVAEPALEPAWAAAAFLASMEACLTRFSPHSELSRLNADPRPVVPASAELRRAVAAALTAAERTGGLVDPTLAPALRAAGYARSRAGLPPASLSAALAAAPARRPAAADPVARWRSVAVDEAAKAILRPPGVELDLGGTAKGLAADRVAARLADARRYAVDVGGDIRVGGTGGEPWTIEVAHPLGGVAHVLELRAGAVATSGIDTRLWKLPGGTFAHHLIDPSTGAPAWTGLIAVTALAPTALTAEALAKAALLAGPGGARRLLRGGGGVLIRDDGEVELLGPARPAPVVRLPRRAAA